MHPQPFTITTSRVLGHDGSLRKEDPYARRPVHTTSLVRYSDALLVRKARARSAHRQGDSSLPAPVAEAEPLDRPREADRAASVPGLSLCLLYTSPKARGVHDGRGRPPGELPWGAGAYS